VREQALPLPPTWKMANEHLDALQRTPSARVLVVGRPELARALALHDLLSDARSQDLADADGRPIPEAAVRSWVQRSLDPAGFSLALGKTVLDEAADASAAAPAPDRAAGDAPEHAAAKGADAPATGRSQSLAAEVLEQLRLASVERVVAEAQRRDSNASRTRVMAELRADPAVRWFGRTIVHLPSEAS
jgi:hypothetical protein